MYPREYPREHAKNASSGVGGALGGDAYARATGGRTRPYHPYTSRVQPPPPPAPPGAPAPTQQAFTFQAVWEAVQDSDAAGASAVSGYEGPVDQPFRAISGTAGRTKTTVATTAISTAPPALVEVLGGASGSTLAHLAAALGHVATLTALAARGLDLSQRNDHGRTPFDYAVSLGHSGAAAYLRGQQATAPALAWQRVWLAVRDEKDEAAQLVVQAYLQQGGTDEWGGHLDTRRLQGAEWFGFNGTTTGYVYT